MSINDFISHILIENVKVNIIFTDKNKNIIDNINTNITFKNSLLKKDDLISLINKYKIFKNKNYKLHSILKYNIDLDLENIKYFIKYPTNFLKSLDKIDDIKWNNSCKFLNELNTLFIIFIEKSKYIKSNKKTLKLIKCLKKNKKKTRKNIIKV